MSGPGLVPDAGPRLVMLSGCSGGGKSSLVERLAARGIATVAEPGRRVIAEERQAGGAALPWIDAAAFATRALAALAGAAPVVLFDRGILDAKIALAHTRDRPWSPDAEDIAAHHRDMFLVPPWPELFAADAERRHDFAAATAEHARLSAGYAAAGYRCHAVPRLPLDERAAWLAARIGHAS